MKILKVLLLLLCSSTILSAQDTTYYSVVSKGKIKGGQKVWKGSEGTYYYAYQFNDRGRGDSTTTVIGTNKDGLINRLEITGIDYYKNPYAEEFSIKGDSAIWTVNGERKSKKFGNELYLTNTAPASFELFLQWIIKQPDRRTAVLPDGFMHTDEPLLRSFSLNGKSVQLKLFSVYFEPSTAPSYIWMTNDMHFFASVSPWSSNVETGYESLVDTLLTLQEIAGQGYYSDEVKNSSRQLAAHILFTHASVFESATATVKKDMTVEVRDGKIIAVYETLSKKASINADTVIDCKGKFLMPGLWDMHGHFSKDEGSSYLAGGVTHLRDMGNDNILLTYKNQIASNKLLGPDISYLSGFIDKEDPFQGPTGLG